MDRVVRTIVNVLCGLFAEVLVAQIIMVGEANPANGVASFVRASLPRCRWGYGLAVIVWLAFGAAVATLIRRFALPTTCWVADSRSLPGEVGHPPTERVVSGEMPGTPV